MSHNKLSKFALTSPLGLPGGPCDVIRNVENENIPERLKKDIIEDIERGKDLTNQQADAIYDRMTVPTKIDLFSRVELTSHAQYRMDQRGVTIPEMQGAFDEFSRWYEARRDSGKRLKPEQQKILEDLSYGKTVRFDAKRKGLTLVFVVENKKARLVSTWWTNSPNPPKPRPGECDYVEYLDKDRTFTRPKILGTETLMRSATRLNQWISKYACGDSCNCEGSCGCDGGECEGGCSCSA